MPSISPPTDIENAMRVPSGLHTGERLSPGSAVRHACPLEKFLDFPRWLPNHHARPAERAIARHEQDSAASGQDRREHVLIVAARGVHRGQHFGYTATCRYAL